MISETHRVERKDAIFHMGRHYVPTIYGQGEKFDTKYVDTWEQFIAAGGCMLFNEDQTEITLHLPVGVKFSCRFNRKADA